MSMARIALVATASRDISEVVPLLAGRRCHEACETCTGPDEPPPGPDSVPLLPGP